VRYRPVRYTPMRCTPPKANTTKYIPATTKGRGTSNNDVVGP
jgi:hypothetical protein